MSKKEDNLKKYLTTEVKYIIGIVVFVIGVVAPYYQIKEDIALIKQNHMSHVETLAKDMVSINEKYTQLKQENDEQDEYLRAIMDKLIEINGNQQ